MPLKYSTRKRSNTRPKAYAALLVALLLLSAAALFGVGASAQRRNDNTSQQQGRSSRRVIVGRGSDNASGSRTTITADDSLNDYSAYRSGDRFYVVLPKSAAGAVSKGSGKGYTDVQVQQRGDSVVVSYKVQPGAKPRVEQKFNRLDVVFDVKDGGQPAASGQQSTAATQQPTGENRNSNASAQQQQQQQQQATQPRQSATPETSNERRPAEATSNTVQPGAVNPSNNAAQPVDAAQQPAGAQTQAAPSPASEQPAQAAPTSEPQIAQNRPPATIAPITNPNPSAAGASFGTMLAQNWPIPLFIALFVIGLGLVVFTRRSSAHAPAELEAAGVATTTTATLKEPRAARLKEATVEAATVEAVAPDVATPEAAAVDADSVATKTAPLAEIAPLIAAPLVAAGKKNKKRRKGKARGGRAEELPLAKVETAEEPSDEVSPTVDASSPVEEAASPAGEVVSPAGEVTSPAEEVATPIEEATSPAMDAASPVADVASSVVAAASVAGVVASHDAEASAESREAVRAEDSASAVEDSTLAVEPASETDASRELSLEPVEPSVIDVDHVVESAALVPVIEPAAEPVTSIAPASAPDPEEVQAQTRRVLEGEPYERSVIGSEDSMARQLIGAELLSALAGRNVERRERARAAFVEHGYFEEKTHDVREAAAPAERAAAARSLAIVGDRSAAPHLISALEDDSMEVRRAAVEALGALREPTAVEPLEALLRREKNERNRIPTRIIQHAIETCRFAAVEESRAATESARVEEAAQVEALAPQVEETARAEEVSPRELELAPFEEPSVETTAHETGEVVETQPVIEEIQPVEEPQPAEEPRSIEELLSVEEPSPVGEAHALDESPFELELEPESVEAGTPVTESNAVEPFFASPPSAFEPAVAEPQVTEESNALAEESSVAAAEAPSVEEASSIEPVEDVVSEDAAGRSLAPFVSSSEPEESAKVGEWIELDMDDIGSTESAYTAPPSPEAVFELSSGETLEAERVAEPEAQTLAVESLPFETAEETPTVETRGIEARGLESLFESSPTETSVEARGAEEEAAEVSGWGFERDDSPETAVEPSVGTAAEAVTAPLPSIQEKGVVPFNENSTVPAVIQQRLTSRDASVRASAITELSHVDSDEAFQQICSAFDDEAKEVRSAAARALYELRTDRAESFTRALREADADRRRNVGAAISSSGLAGEAISQLTGESRDKTYEAFSLLFLMAKAGEVQPLVRAIEGHPNNEVRLAVVKLLALSGQKEILPAFRRLAVRGSLPTEVRSAVMEAIYQISSSQPTTV